jgi:hypothetical protein
MERETKIALILLIAMTFISVIVTAERYLYSKNYNFLVESPCDEKKEKCFIRDCTSGNDCPPNMLEKYQVFKVRAQDFSKCKDNSCLQECVTQKISCTPIQCGSLANDTCSDIL